MASKRLLATVVAVLVLSGAMNGCGFGQDDAPGGRVVTIGVAAPLSGPDSVYGRGMRRAVQLAIDEANTSARAKEHDIIFRLRAEDDAADPETAVDVAKTLDDDGMVVAVVGHFNSGCTLAAASTYEDAGLPIITVSSNSSITAMGYPRINRIVANDSAQGAYASDLAIWMGFRRIALIDDSTPYGIGLAGAFGDSFTAAGGTLVSVTHADTRQDDFSEFVDTFARTRPDAIYYAGSYAPAAVLTRQAKEAGHDIPLMGGDTIFSAEYIRMADPVNADGDLATALGLPLGQMPGAQTFVTAYRKAFNRQPTGYDAYAYDAAQVIIGSVLRVGPSRTEVARDIRETSTLGVTGTIAFDANGDNRQQAISAYRVRDGEWAQLTE